MEDCLSKYKKGDIDGILSQDGGVLMGVWDAITEANRQDDGWLIVNADGINGVCQLIKEGKCVGTTQLPCGASVDALQRSDRMPGRQYALVQIHHDGFHRSEQGQCG